MKKHAEHGKYVHKYKIFGHVFKFLKKIIECLK